jgi:ABC-2 type transport system ATP-binding protein
MYRIPRRVARARCAELLARVGLSDRADDPVEQLSRGMKQRLHLARGMVHSPRVLFLDEPTSGMDPLAAREFRRVVEKLRAEGRTVLLTTHDMAEAEALCDQVSVIDKGRMILDGRPEEVVRRLQRVDSVDFALPDGESLVLDALRAMEAVEEVRDMPGGDEWRAVPRDEEALREILAVLVRHGVRTLRTARPSLEEAYLELMPSSEVPA